MAPGRKKKKQATNPARGFATVSLPSKAKVEAEIKPEEDSGEHESQHNDVVHGEAAIESRDGQPAAISEMTPEDLEKHLEEADLQAFLEKNGAQSKKDSGRQAARLAVERRTLRLHANQLSTVSWLSEKLVGDFLDSSQNEQKQITSYAFASSPTDIEADLTSKAWALRRLLEAMDLPKTDEALKHVLKLAYADAVSYEKDSMWGLPDSLEWYAHNANELDIALYEMSISQPTAESRSPSVSRPDTPDVEEMQNSTTESQSGQVDDVEGSDHFSNDNSDSDDDNDPSKLSNKWMTLRRDILRLEHLAPGLAVSSRIKSRVAQKQKRLKDIESDPLFDQYEAELAWRDSLPQFFAEIQADKSPQESKHSSRRDFNSSDQGSQIPVNARNGKVEKKRIQPGAKQGDIKTFQELKQDQNQQELDIMFGDMFVAPEPYKPSQTPPEPQPNLDVQLIDYGKWSGTNPRRVLEETCKIRDKKSRVQFSLVTKTSYSNRHKLMVHWSINQTYDPWLASLPKSLTSEFSPLLVEIEMQLMATPTAAQSEAYVSTVALFALCLTTPGQQKMSLRLPAVWRDVYEELARARNLVMENAEKEEIKHIRQLVEDMRIESDQGKAQLEIPTNLTTDVREDETHPHHKPESAPILPSEIIQREWAMRMSTPQFLRMQEKRAQLPISAYRQQIVDCVGMNSITIISAETGAGKSTQVPSFLLEHNLSSGRDCRILVTQPRRISAITLARRVSQELGEAPNDIGSRKSVVGYSIRLESKVSLSTRLTFATTGVLLRMIETSPDLDNLDYLMLDEVHERTMDLDLLFITVRHLVRRHRGLKVVLMSATVDSTRFAEYFDNAPVLQIPGRTFPVEIGYLGDAMAAVGKYTNTETVQQEITEDDLLFDREDMSRTTKSTILNGEVQPSQDVLYDYRINYTLIVDLTIAIATKAKYVNYSKAILVFMPGIGEIRRLYSALLAERMFQQGWIIHMLHSSFSTEDLERAFMLPPGGMRKIVISTNIAETGVTIPDITAVIDTCKEKIMRFDDRRQMSRLTEGFISRASSRQRRGRAARVQPGLCFHLVSKTRYDTLMLDQSVPEMLRLSLQDAILRIKIWNLGAIEDTLKQAIDPPTPKNIRRAMEALKDAGALTTGEALTPLGSQVARLPLDVSLSKLVLLGIALRCLDAAISIVAILSSKSPFLVSPHVNDQSAAASAKAIFSRGDSDLLTIYAAYIAWQKASATGSVQIFCRKHSLSAQVLSQIQDQKIQLLVQVVDAGLLRFTETEKAALRSARSGNSYNRKSFFEIPERFNTAGTSDACVTSVIAAAFYPKLLIRQGNGWRNVSSNQMTSLAPTSINNSKFNHKPPKWLSFYEAMQTRSGHTNAMETTSVPEAAIVLLLGEAQFNIWAGVIIIDNGRVKFSVKEWRTLMALKILRTKLKDMLNSFYQNAGKAASETDEKWLKSWFMIMEAVDKQNEMAKARMLTSAHHAPTNIQKYPAPSSNGNAIAPARGIPERGKEGTDSTRSSEPRQGLQKSNDTEQSLVPKRILNPHADLHAQ